MNSFDELTKSFEFIASQTANNLFILTVVTALLALFFLISHALSNKVLLLGIIPRKRKGLWGILFAPLLHAHFNHLFFNWLPLLVLSNFILMTSLSYYLLVTLMITLLSGTAIWLTARPGLHIGASALITGYWSFLVINSYHQGTLIAIILGLTSMYYFAGIFLGIFPGKKGVSWEGHLAGFLAGIVTAYLI